MDKQGLSHRALTPLLPAIPPPASGPPISARSRGHAVPSCHKQTLFGTTGQGLIPPWALHILEHMESCGRLCSKDIQIVKEYVSLSNVP